jgi:CxxC-x17-CxxC domain-containing protein
MSAYTDQILTCADCGAEFAFTGQEQAFYAEKGFTSAPRRCKPCRAAHKAQRAGGSGPSFGAGRPRSGGMGGDRQMFDATCASCGKETQVPFKPSGVKPVYCRDCFRK